MFSNGEYQTAVLLYIASDNVILGLTVNRFVGNIKGIGAGVSFPQPSETIASARQRYTYAIQVSEHSSDNHLIFGKYIDYAWLPGIAMSWT